MVIGQLVGGAVVGTYLSGVISRVTQLRFLREGHECWVGVVVSLRRGGQNGEKKDTQRKRERDLLSDE